MDKNDNEIADLIMQMINAIDDLQVARGGNTKNEEEAFATLLQIRNVVEAIYYA